MAQNDRNRNQGDQRSGRNAPGQGGSDRQSRTGSEDRGTNQDQSQSRDQSQRRDNRSDQDEVDEDTE